MYTPLLPTGGTQHATVHLPLQNDLATNDLVRRESSNHRLPGKFQPTFRAFQIFVSVVFCNSFMPAFNKLAVAVLVVLQQIRVESLAAGLPTSRSQMQHKV